MNRIRLFSALATIAVGLVGCSDEILLKNAHPRVTWVASEYLADEDVARLTIWIADIEGDPVDMAITVIQADHDITLAPGSYPLKGRPTREFVNDPNGAPQELLWALDSGIDGEVTLTISVDDDEHDADDADQYTVRLDPRVDNEPVAATLVQAR